MAQNTYQPKLWSNLSILTLAAVASSGCQSGVNTAYTPAYPAYDYSSIAPAAGPLPQSVQSYAPPVAYQALEAANLELKERLERVEKAMLRLDRRMQLVERNELNRMGGTQQTSQAASTADYASVSSPSDEQTAMRALNIGPGPNGDTNYRPVASRNETITSALQAAPGLASGSFGDSESAPVQIASRAGLPSLADPTPVASRSLQQGNTDVAIWTVKYESNKVWPDRTQLPSSRDVVESLRRSGAGNGALTLYARGKNANGVEFRERVKALSRYLSKVSSLDSVPIAAMSAPHLDDQTIEILATH